jgi:hypothetical protein
MGVMQRFNGRVAFKATPLKSAASGLTAHSGGGKASALPITVEMASIGTVAAAADSILLPAAVPGRQLFISNDAATNSMQVFGLGTDTINSVATATGVAQAAGVSASYNCAKAGNWNRVLSS